MRVFVVELEVPYDGAEVIGVFSSLEKALEYIKILYPRLKRSDTSDYIYLEKIVEKPTTNELLTPGTVLYKPFRYRISEYGLQ